MQATERSRAYPVLSLEDGRRVMRDILAGLGEGSFSREVLGEVLGYSNARGGPGARKIAALAQYGLLRRRAGLYSPTSLARRLVEPSSDAARKAALHRALRRPPLFAALLDRYLPQGRIPSQLAAVLWRDYGITRKASRAAAETFCESARYAEVMDRDGIFLGGLEMEAPRELGSDTPAGAETGLDAAEQRFEFAITGGRVARLFLPLSLCRRDLEIIRRQIKFLEYQVEEEDSA